MRRRVIFLAAWLLVTCFVGFAVSDTGTDFHRGIVASYLKSAASLVFGSALLPSTAATYDLGSATYAWDDTWLGSSGNVVWNNDLFLSRNASGQGRIGSSAGASNGSLLVGGGGATALILSSSDTSGASVKTSSGEVMIREGDDSAFTNVQADAYKSFSVATEVAKLYSGGLDLDDTLDIGWGATYGTNTVGLAYVSAAVLRVSNGGSGYGSVQTDHITALLDADIAFSNSTTDASTGDTFISRDAAGRLQIGATSGAQNGALLVGGGGAVGLILSSVDTNGAALYSTTGGMKFMEGDGSAYNSIYCGGIHGYNGTNRTISIQPDNASNYLIGIASGMGVEWTNSATSATTTKDIGLHRHAANILQINAGTISDNSYGALYTNSINVLSGSSIAWANSTTDASTVDTGLARSAAGVAKITDGSTGIGKLYTARPCEAHTTSDTLTATESNSVHTNRGAGATTNHVLPAVASSTGVVVTFYAVVNQDVMISPASGEAILPVPGILAGLVADEDIKLDDIGDSVTLMGDGTNWLVIDTTGTPAEENP